MHETMLLAAAPPPLPESETSHGFARLRALRKKEQIQLVSGLRTAQVGEGIQEEKGDESWHESILDHIYAIYICIRGVKHC